LSIPRSETAKALYCIRQRRQKERDAGIGFGG
jgi:hypothetical protein